MDSRKIIEKHKKIINGSLRRSPAPQALAHNIAKFHKATDELATARLSGPNPPIFECKKGCSHCCSLRVEALPPEVFRIAKHLQGLESETRSKFVQSLKEAASYAAGREFKYYENPCPFLSDAGGCEIYSVRPHKCRAYFSGSVSACAQNKAAIQDAELRNAENVLANEIIQTYKKKGVVMHPVELSQGVLKALEDLSIEARWTAGDQVFDLLPERIML